MVFVRERDEEEGSRMEALGVAREDRNSVPLGSDVFLADAGFRLVGEGRNAVFRIGCGESPGISPFLPPQGERRARLVLFLGLLDALRRKDFERMVFQGNSVLMEHYVAKVGGGWGFLKRRNGLHRCVVFLTVSLSAAFYQCLLWENSEHWLANGRRAPACVRENARKGSQQACGSQAV